MISLGPMRAKYRSGRKTPKRRKWNSSPGSLTNVSIAKRPQRRSHLLHLYVLLALYLTSLLWTQCPLWGPRTHTVGLLVSHFGRIPLRNILLTSHNRPPPPKGPFKPRIRNPPPSQTFDPEVEATVPPEKTDTKGSQQCHSFNKKGRGGGGNQRNRTDSLPVGGKLARYQSCCLELFPQFPEIIWKVSQGILIAFTTTPDTSSSFSGVKQQQQALRPSSSCDEAVRLSSHRRSEGHLVTGLLQLPVSVSQARRIVQTNHRSQEIKSTSGHTFVQDGNSLLHDSSPAATGMDYQDRPKRCLPSYPGPCEHPQVLSLCYSWKDLSIPCTPV